MATIANERGRPSPFLTTSSLVITTAGVTLLTPFAINNFIQGRTLLGVGSLIIVGFCALNSWNCVKKRYQPMVILLGLAPCIILFLVFAFRELGIIGALWSYPAALSFYFMLPGRYAWIANLVLIGVVLPEAWGVFDPPTALRFGATSLTMSIFAGVSIRFITRQQVELEEMAVNDALTGLFNRAQLRTNLERALG